MHDEELIWYVFNCPILRLSDVKPLFTDEVLEKIVSIICPAGSPSGRENLRKQIVLTAGEYFFVKKLYEKNRVSTITREARKFHKAVDHLLTLSREMSPGLVFYLLCGMGESIQAVRQGKLKPSEDNSLLDDWIALALQDDKTPWQLIDDGRKGVYHLSIAAGMAEHYLLEDKDKGGRNRNFAARVYIGKLAKMYLNETKRVPKITYNPYRKKYEGHFFCFVEANVNVVIERANRPTNCALGEVIKRVLRSDRRRLAGLQREASGRRACRRKKLPSKPRR